MRCSRSRARRASGDDADAYNLGAFAPTADEVRAEVLRAFPSAEITYHVDEKRQGIVDSWPEDVDDSAARQRLGLRARSTTSTGAFRDYPDSRRFERTDTALRVQHPCLDVPRRIPALVAPRVSRGHLSHGAGGRRDRLVLARSARHHAARHVPRPARLARVVRRSRFDVRVDTAFEAVMRACADRQDDDEAPGSARRSSSATSRCIGSASRIRSRPGRATSSSAVSTACTSAARSSASRCSTA